MHWVVKRFSSYLNIEAPPEQRWCHAQVTATQFATYEAAVFVRNAERSNPIVRDPKALRVVTVRTREDLRREREALRAALNEAALTCLGMAKIADVRKSGSDIVEAAFPKVDEWLALARGATPPPSKPAAPVASKPVCRVCNDTHRVNVRYDICQDCPHPCEKCEAPAGAYCQTTPCPCTCHRAGAGAATTKETTKEEPQ